MGNQYLFALLRSRIGVLLLWGALFSALSFFGLMLTEKPFQARTDFLVVQTNTENQDFYSLFKSSEYLGKLMSEAIYSERFISAMVETGRVNKEFLPFDKSARLKAWKNTVTVDKNLELGIISVTIKGDHERDVTRIMEATTVVLTEQSMLFRGGDPKSIEIRILSGPILEQSPTMGKIIKVLLAAFVAGFLTAAFFVAVKYEAMISKIPRDEDLPLDQTVG